MKTRLNLGSYLSHHSVTPYRLAQQLKGRIAQNTVYNLARTPQQRIDLDTVSDVLSGLSELTGQPVTLTDLLEVVADPIPSSVQAPLEQPIQDKTPFDGKAFLENARVNKPVALGLSDKQRVPEGGWSIEDQFEETRGRDL